MIIQKKSDLESKNEVRKLNIFNSKNPLYSGKKMEEKIHCSLLSDPLKIIQVAPIQNRPFNFNHYFFKSLNALHFWDTGAIRVLEYSFD